ncbi:Asp23/Gls24 family envelope stress response protein [Furfurilactobacillus sp. WILCCON 0119]|uniref:Asp23/Gls24 family envelope stress response protein n=1 Tax=Furfurilactobacillus entadae TaxID=2922307 RepID=UPI0035ECBEBA
MPEVNNITLNQPADALGTIEIAADVLEIIVGAAASQVDGVNRMRGTIANNVSELFGRTELSKGVKLSIDHDTISVDVFVYLDYGVNVPKVALAMQDKVKQQVSLMTELAINEVNVHIVGIVPEKNDSEIDPDDIFGDHAQATDVTGTQSSKDGDR